ncbi:MAG: 2-succinyl-6-hydroxy-2,4-cyclohexadiene-carboxylate synthase [Symbiobacteriaceae bacterium]|nr:2-succinyl-6-hydroxy-2,4-cyclohexadiene-carboxylate synthase [Symbiobacteriaceae bacterium]
MLQNHRPAGPPLPFEEAGDGFPVLLVPGRLNDSRLWAPVADMLCKRYRSIRCDIRVESSNRSAQAADRSSRLLGLMDWLGIARCHVVAYGSGWSWAAGLAARAPGRAASLTVVDPVVPRAEHSPTVQENWHLEMLLQWLSVSHGSVVRKPEHVTVLAGVVAQQTHARIAEANEPGLAPALGAPEFPILEGICCPVMALVGQEAGPESKALVASVFGQTPRFQLAQVSGAVRHSPLEAPRAVADLLQRFLGTCL